MSILDNAQALDKAVTIANAKSSSLLTTLDDIIDRMEARVAYWETEASWVDIYNIVEDIKRGEFSYPDATNIKYYNNQRIEVIARVDNDYYPIELEVTLINDEGDAYPLCNEQYKFIKDAWEKDLIIAGNEAYSEANYIKHLHKNN